MRFSYRKIGKNMEEVPTRIEPAFFEDNIPPILADLVVEIQSAASQLGQSLNENAAFELSDLVRVMNCYYSNLIEGHNTRPKDIERALAGAELEEATRPLALEAKAHVVVQREIDQMNRLGRLPMPTSGDFVSWVHRRFYEEMPAEFRFVERADGQKIEIVPGVFRSQAADDVSVGRHQPPSSQYVLAFMKHFSERYKNAQTGATNRIIAIAAAHHRLNFIHPFTDGNGRVSRLMSHAMAQKSGVGGRGLWAISRGLARGLNDKTEYKRMMDHADQQRMGDRDGRGNLSAKALQDYCEWFLSVALDQIKFSNVVFAFDTLEARYRNLTRTLLDDRRAPDVISAVLKHGSMDRGDISLITKTSDRTARNTLKELLDIGFLKSSTPKAPVRVAFPVDYRDRLFPNLFADVEVEAPAPQVPAFLKKTESTSTAMPLATATPDVEFQQRIDNVPTLLKAIGIQLIVGKIADEALANSGGQEVDWRNVEDRVITEAIGEHGFSRTAVIDALSKYSPGTLSENQKDDLTIRVYEAAPRLVSKYNKKFEGREPKR